MKFRLTLPKILIIVAIIAFLFGIFLPVGMITLADPKPKLPPQEQNRIHHPNGFSIITPKGWMSSIDSESNNTYDSIIIFPNNKARFAPSIEAIRYKDSEGAHRLTKHYEFHKSKFLDFEAMIFEGRIARYHV